MMATLVKRLAMGVETPLVFDSTDADVVARGARDLPRPARMINSINMENGRERIDAVVPLAVRARRRLRRAHDRRGRDGQDRRAQARRRAPRSTTSASASSAWRPSDLIFDALTFTLATGQDEFRRSAVETIEGIRAVKRELPGVWTVLGVSNVSFGLEPAARGRPELGVPAPRHRRRARRRRS